MCRHALYILLLVIVCSHVQSVKVLLVSMDGFRWDYINQTDTPNFDKLSAKGTHAPFINNPFVTKTFPSHYTIATGLYEESHGIVSNKMYDPVFNETFTMRSKETKWWDGGEPLWVTVQKHRLRSGVFFWPGSESEIHGLRPNIWKPYDESVPFEERVDTVIQWLSNDTFDIDVAMLYFHEPDSTGHAYGPNSPEIKEKVREMDDVLGYIVKAFDYNNLWSSVNLVVTSDHGMAEVDHVNKLIDLSQYINISLVYQCPLQGPALNMLPYEGYVDTIYNAIKDVSHMTVYKKEDIPERWHYKNNRRILPIFAIAEEGWQIALNASTFDDDSIGAHGFDNNLMSMRPIFYARGPSFRSNYQTQPFESVDIYPMICNILGISPAQNNGSLARTKDFMVVSGSVTLNVNICLTLLVTILALQFGE